MLLADLIRGAVTRDGGTGRRTSSGSLAAGAVGRAAAGRLQKRRQREGCGGSRGSFAACAVGVAESGFVHKLGSGGTVVAFAACSRMERTAIDEKLRCHSQAEWVCGMVYR